MGLGLPVVTGGVEYIGIYGEFRGEIFPRSADEALEKFLIKW